MMLYTKGERRYTEASSADILSAAAKTLSNLGMGEKAIWLSGVADAEQARELRDDYQGMVVESKAKQRMLPEQKIDLPRKGAEPA